ncbi:MAG: SurA N-terminal domain-containing protein [Patescibacteria group bacterium]|nr:SurA N-terminal domain-containing protein [Patescibacteria group bacterium]
MKKFFENKPRAWFVVGLILVTLMTAGLLGYLYFNKEIVKNPDVVAVVDGEDIMITDFKAWLYSQDNAGTSQNPSKWEEIKNDNDLKKYYLDTYIDTLIVEKDATSQSITVTEEEIDAKYAATPTSNYNDLTEEQKTLSRANTRAAITQEKTEAKTFGWVSGEYIFYRFDKYYAYEEEEKIDGAGDPVRINNQRTYAEAKATAAFQRLDNGTSTIADENKLLESDPEISYKAFAPYSPHITGKTTKEEYLNDISLFDPTLYTGFKASIQNLEKEDYSAPFVLQGNVNGVMKDVAYVVFHAQDKGTGAYQDKESWYESLLKKFKVKIYYSSLGITGVDDKQFSLGDFLESVTPTVYADCSLSPSALHRTQFLLSTIVLNNDGVNWTRWPNAKFYLQAGTSAASPQLDVYGHDCVYWGRIFGEHKLAQNDGYMYSGQTYNAGGTDQLGFLANCTATSTATVAAYKPVSSAWFTNSGPIYKYYENCCNNWVSEAADSYWQGVNMAGYNGLTIHFEFAYQPQYIKNYTLTVAKNGTGSGTVTGTSINCGSDCSETWPETTQVVLTATPDTNSTFAGWSGGGCSGTSTCLVTMDASKTVTATFNASVPSALGLSCSVSPASGPVPLVITVNVTPVNLPTSIFDYKFQIVGSTTPEELLGRGASIYYSLPSAGRYNAWVRNAGYLSNQWVSCTPAEVTVTDPTDSDGGEVAP